MFMLATLNPGGRKARRRKVRISRSRKSRSLTPWQRMVRKHGGVMQAIKARKKHKRRRSAVSRRSLRSRPRMKKKEVIMARTASRRRRRKTHSRGRGGRFVSRRNGGRRRRTRKNSWFKQPIRHSRAAKLGRRRRARRYQANSVIPVSWNPRRRRSGRRSYRRNSPVLPFFAMNPASIVGDITGKIKSFIDVKFLTQTVVPATGGFLATKVLGNVVAEKISGFVSVTPLDKSYVVVRIGSQALTAAGLSYLVGRFVGREQGKAFFLGGAIAVVHAILKEIIPAADQSKYGLLDGLGNGLSERMRDAVQRRIQSSLNGGFGSYLNTDGLRPQDRAMGSYVNAGDLQRQPTYAGSPAGDLRDYDVNRTEVAL